MAFINNTIEDSLKILNNNQFNNGKTRGRPRKVHKIPIQSPSKETFSPFKIDTSPVPCKSNNSPSHTSIVLPVTPHENDELLENNENDELLENNELLENDKVRCDITSEIEKKYFKIIRYIRNGDELLYAITYDLHGQIVYIELDNKKISDAIVQSHNMEKHDYIEYPFAQKDYYKNKLNSSIYGVVMTRGENCCFITRTNSGDIVENYYGASESINQTINTYCVYKYTDIMEDLNVSIQSISETYEMIQQRYLVMNKRIYTDTIECIKNVSNEMKIFDRCYQSFSANILEDWERFSNVSVGYTDKIMVNDIENEDREKLNCISANLFARFQAYNNVGATISELLEVITALTFVKTRLNEYSEQFKNDNVMHSKILKPDEVNILI